MTFREHAARWIRDVLPMYKYIAEMMGHAAVNRQLTYIQTMDAGSGPQSNKSQTNWPQLATFLTRVKNQWW